VQRDWRLIDVPFYRIDEAADLLARAFASDRVIAQFVPIDLPERGVVLREFFKAACITRLAYNQPLLGLEWNNKMVAVASVQTTYTPKETESVKRAWKKVTDKVGPSGLAGLEAYVGLRQKNLPPRLHYYLVCLGVDPAYQSMGFGKAMIECVMEKAVGDTTAAGVMLDTDGDKNLVFYERCGFSVAGREDLNGVDLLFMYRAVR
jgi:ribosomal protein S18 acetylase RimI-like enzyme